MQTGSHQTRCAHLTLGCGYGTLPWSLPLSSNIHWFDVDLPAVLQEKQVLPAAVHTANL